MATVRDEDRKAAEAIRKWLSKQRIGSVHTREVQLRRAEDSVGQEAWFFVASAFVALQEQRDAADYDHQADFTRPATLGYLGRARRAVALIESESNSDDFRAFFGLIALQTSIRR